MTGLDFLVWIGLIGLIAFMPGFYVLLGCFNLCCVVVLIVCVLLWTTCLHVFCLVELICLVLHCGFVLFWLMLVGIYWFMCWLLWLFCGVFTCWLICFGRRQVLYYSYFTCFGFVGWVSCVGGLILCFGFLCVAVLIPSLFLLV